MLKKIFISLSSLVLAVSMATAQKKDSVNFEISGGDVITTANFFGYFLPGDSMLVELGTFPDGNDIGTMRDVLPEQAQINTYNFFNYKVSRIEGNGNIDHDTLMIRAAFGQLAHGYMPNSNLTTYLRFIFKRNNMVYRTVSKRIGNYSTVTALESNSALTNEFLMINIGENVSVINNSSSIANFVFYDFIGKKLLEIPLVTGQTIIPSIQHGIYLIEVNEKVKQKGKL